MEFKNLNPDGSTDALTGADIPVSGTDATKIAAALADKQEAITSDNAASVRTALGLKNGALLRVEGGYVMIRVEANSTATADIVFDPPFADTPNAQITMTTSADPAPFSACISALSANGITIKVESTFTAVRNIAARWLAIG